MIARRYRRWRRAQPSRLELVVFALPGWTITPSGLAKTESFVPMLVERRPSL